MWEEDLKHIDKICKISLIDLKYKAPGVPVVMITQQGILTNWMSTQVMKRKDQLLPNIGLHVWLMTSKQTEPDLQFASIQKWLETKLLS